MNYPVLAGFIWIIFSMYTFFFVFKARKGHIFWNCLRCVVFFSFGVFALALFDVVLDGNVRNDYLCVPIIFGLFSLYSVIKWLRLLLHKDINAIFSSTDISGSPSRNEPTPEELILQDPNMDYATKQEKLRELRGEVFPVYEPRQRAEQPTNEAANLTSTSALDNIIRFEYRDSDDEKTIREVKVQKVDQYYLYGYCSLASAPRTFRRDGIIRFFGDSEQNFKIIDARLQKLKIIFTGFKQADKTRLEALAKKNNMRVGGVVTTDLFMLVTGKKNSPTKEKQAKKNGAYIMSESQFINFIETGEV